MNDDKSNLEGRSNVAADSSNTAANSSSRQASEIPANQLKHDGVEPPPPYSQAPSTAQYPNQPGMHYPVQQQGYPPMYPAGPHAQQPQFQLGGIPVQGGTLNPVEETRIRQEHTIRQGIAASVVTGRYVVRRSWTYRLARLFISFMLVGIILLIILGVLIVHPALNDIALQSAQCEVLSSEYTDDYISCDCGRYCTSSYPCLQIHVSYSAEGKRQTAYLYQDVYADKNKCSVQSCYSDYSINKFDTTEFMEKYGDYVGQSYTCYYNPKTPDEVFANHASVSSDEMKIMHCILWPFVLVIFCGAMLGILFCRSKGHCCFKKVGGPVPYQNLQATA